MGVISLSAKRINSDFVKKVEEISGQKVLSCYQCGECSASCPLASKMDLLPNQVIRLVQLGDEAVLDSQTLSICSCCFECGARCPRGVDIAKVIEALRQIKVRKDVDMIALSGLEELDELPQIALVSNFRKFTG